MRLTGRPSRGLKGEVCVPGDKSISHRALILGSIAQGVSWVRNFSSSNDCLATLECLECLGVDIQHSGHDLRIHGVGLRGLQEAGVALNCQGSATTMRLLAGLLAGQSFSSVLDGNSSLRKRPMERIVEPLERMGASILAGGGGTPPLAIRGGELRAIDYQLSVASAQVKSAVLLAGLYAEGETSVRELTPSRDHTERLLRFMGADVEISQGKVTVCSSPLEAMNLSVLGDISSAAFFIVAACLLPGSELVLSEVGVNPTRTGFLEALQQMGAEIEVGILGYEGSEPIADLTVRSANLRGIDIGGAMIPCLIDELPILAVAATQAEGVTTVRDATELRVKESDRIATMARELRKMGARIEETPDGFVIEGPSRLRGAQLESHGDHRLAMSLAVAALVAEGESTIAGSECVVDSFPGFRKVLGALLEAGQSTGRLRGCQA